MFIYLLPIVSTFNQVLLSMIIFYVSINNGKNLQPYIIKKILEKVTVILINNYSKEALKIVVNVIFFCEIDQNT